MKSTTNKYNVLVQLGRINVDGRRVSVTVTAKNEEEAASLASVASCSLFEQIHGKGSSILNKYRHVIEVVQSV